MSQWRVDRSKGIGGSEWGDVLDMEPYGCGRRLWYKKRRVEADFDQGYTGYFERGHEMEPLVARAVEKKHKMKTRKVKVMPKTNLPSWWFGHVDYGITAATAPEGCKGPGVLECKTKGPFPYREVVRDGVPDNEKLQMMHYMALTKRSWALYAMLEPVSWMLYPEVLHYDPETVALMKQRGEFFWRQVQNGPIPNKLLPSDRRCQRCAWRWTCQGEGLIEGVEDGEKERLEDERLAVLIEERDRLQAEKATVTIDLDNNKAELQAIINKVGKFVYGERPIVWSRGTKRKLDRDRLEKEKPKIFAAYSKEVPSEYFRVF